MRTNSKGPKPRSIILKRKLEEAYSDAPEEKAFAEYTDDDIFNAEVEPIVGDMSNGHLQFYTGVPTVVSMYDSSDPRPYKTLGDDMLLYLSKLAISFYNIMEDSPSDSPYNLALYLSQLSLVSYYGKVLRVSVAKHDIESVKVLKLVKPVAEVPTFYSTFNAPLLDETEGKSVETFETEICMPTLFPTTTTELMSDARVITA